ncbi:MAG: ECF transporter S component [Clostridium sp.]|jgi:uncharacterized membrane protein|nr:ECF transporter S component [Clostridium sp.]
MKTIQRTKKGVLAAAVAALIFVMTFLIRFPLPMPGGGYIHMGDAILFLSAIFLGPGYCAAAAAIGSALADLAAGATLYILPTVLIKGLMGLLMSWNLTKKSPIHRCRYALACVLGVVLMIGGYFVFEFAVMGLSYAIMALPFNAIQGAANFVAAIFLLPVAERLSKQI